MTIVTPSYRPKRVPRKKRKQPPIANRIVTPAPLQPRKGPVIQLGATIQLPTDGKLKSAIVEPKRKRTSIFGAVPDMTEEEHRGRDDATDALFREIVRRATSDER